MEWYWFALIGVVFWIVGAIRQAAYVDSMARKQNKKIPSYIGLFILMLMSWPYWYFYYKA